MITVLHGALTEGATLVTLPKFDVETFLSTMHVHKVSFAHLVPPLILFLTKHPAVKPELLASLITINSGAAPLEAALQSECAARLDCECIQGYGMTETSPVVMIEDNRKPGSVGMLIPSTEAKILRRTAEASDGQDAVTSDELCDVGEEGELLLRGPQVMAGYLGREAATLETLTADGFVRTGDVAYVDSEGYFYLVDRVKELIKVKGLQVAPAELEGVLREHHAVADAAVVAQPDERAGELPRGFIVLRAGIEATVKVTEEIAAFVAERVAPHKRLAAVEVIEAIPKSASGKILRRVLKDEYVSR